MPNSKKNTKGRTKGVEKSEKAPKARSWSITADAIAVLEAYKGVQAGNAKNVASFVSEAIIAYGATVLGDHMPELEGVTECRLPNQLGKIKKELAELRGRLIELELPEEKKKQAIALLKKHKIQSAKQMRTAWDNHAIKKTFQKYLHSIKDWKIFIEKHKDDLS
ncbi:hypothetical protein [Desulfovibrio subterraneus]|uniref:Uncharacterized protein n=1 Tax=Desulfovibrio subterraneus TaxID=2718620 RepID=A0A7J0BMF1_9BACT|nr:hypothetical protein [Desulfovibrio subterraneus]GFM34856.1 hypothetical protein DSM101010T_32210 [Desulfovibrio subterraneus]